MKTRNVVFSIWNVVCSIRYMHFMPTSRCKDVLRVWTASTRYWAILTEMLLRAEGDVKTCLLFKNDGVEYKQPGWWIEMDIIHFEKQAKFMWHRRCILEIDWQVMLRDEGDHMAPTPMNPLNTEPTSMQCWAVFGRSDYLWYKCLFFGDWCT